MVTSDILACLPHAVKAKRPMIPKNNKYFFNVSDLRSVKFPKS